MFGSQDIGANPELRISENAQSVKLWLDLIHNPDIKEENLYNHGVSIYQLCTKYECPMALLLLKLLLSQPSSEILSTYSVDMFIFASKIDNISLARQAITASNYSCRYKNTITYSSKLNPTSWTREQRHALGVDGINGLLQLFSPYGFQGSTTSWHWSSSNNPYHSAEDFTFPHDVQITL